MSGKSDRIYGRIPVLECLRARRRAPRRLFLLHSAKGLEEIEAAAGHTPIEETTRDNLDKLAKGGVHQGVVLEVGPMPVLQIEDCIDRLPQGDALVVLLDSVEDPHNLGAIARSAVALGANALVFTRDRSAPLSATAVKTAAGAMEYLDLVEVTNLARAMEKLKDAGFWIAGLEADGDQLIWDANLTGRTAIIIGSEGKGMRRLTREKCDFLLRIPITGPITSLNASVSAAIVLAEVARQREAKK